MFLDYLHSNGSAHVYSPEISEISRNLIYIFGLKNVNSEDINEIRFCASNIHSEYISRMYVNWNVCATIRNSIDGSLPLFTVAVMNLDLANGLGHCLQANGAAIEEVDPVTGLEAFMLAAVGRNSKLESVYTLLQAYPAAIIPHVGRRSVSQGSSSS